MKTYLITGSNGLLGQKIVYALRKRNDFTLVATSRGDNRLVEKSGYVYEPFDITSKEEAEKIFLKYKPDVVFNTAAMTNVDACETQRDECRKMNVDAVKYMTEVLEKTSSPSYNPQFIHLSTDFIFDGESGPYKEDDIPNPQSFYAQSKLDSETIVRQSSIRWTIIRTIIVYGIVDNMSRSNVVLWAKDALGKGQKINVVNDQYRSPTLAEDLAQGCILAADKGKTGIYHISGKDIMSILELVNRVADFWKLDKSFVTPVTSDTIKQPARRPAKTGFILDKAIHELGYNPHSFEEGLTVLDEQLKKRIVIN